MVKAVFVFVLLGLVAVQFGSAEDVKCFICDKCDSVSDLKATACSKDTAEATKKLFNVRNKRSIDIREGGGDANTITPPTTKPPTTKPPTTKPPTTKPPTTKSPGTKPPGTKPPGTKPPGTTDAPPTYKCFKMTYKDKDDKEQTKRGCTYKECTTIEKDEKVASCKTCDKDECNPAANIKSWALSSVILVAIIKMFL